MSESIRLFSRDSRTYHAFRETWHEYLSKKGYILKVSNRFESGTVRSFLNALLRRGDRYIIFGSSEILFYLFISRKCDLWVFTGLGRLLQEGTLRSSLILLYLKLFYRQQKIIVLNENDKIIMQYIFGSNVLRISGEGYNFSRLDNKHALKIAKVKTHNPLKFCYFGRLLKSKGVENIVDAFLARQTDEVTLNLYGDFDFGNSDGIDKKYQMILSDNNNKIEYHGHVENVALHLAKNHVFISLSQREGLSFSVLEALYLGLVVLLSPVAGNLEFEGLDGVYFVDEQKLPAVVQELAKHPQRFLLTSEAANSRRRALVEKFGNSSVQDELSVLF